MTPRQGSSLQEKRLMAENFTEDQRDVLAGLGVRVEDRGNTQSVDAPTLNEFFETQGGAMNRAWIRERHLNAYVRVTRHAVDASILKSGQTEGGSVFIPTIDIASVEVDEGHRGQGVFTEFLDRVEEIAQENEWSVYVELVHNERLRAFLGKRGYRFVRTNSGCDKSYLKTFGGDYTRSKRKRRRRRGRRS